MTDYGSMEGSEVGSLSGFGLEFDFAAATGSSFTVDSESGLDSGSKTEGRSQPAISRLVVGCFQSCDRLSCNKYMNITSEGNLSNNA